MEVGPNMGEGLNYSTWPHPVRVEGWVDSSQNLTHSLKAWGFYSSDLPKVRNALEYGIFEL